MSDQLNEEHPEDPERKKEAAPDGSGRDYEVGYGKPPKATQFPPGRSGNPNGRPKGKRNAVTEFREALETKYAVTENGRKRKVSATAVIYKRTIKDAIEGKAKARDQVFEWMRYFGLVEAGSGGDRVELSAADRAMLIRVLGDDLGGEPPADRETGEGEGGA